MSTEIQPSKMTRVSWSVVFLALVVGIGIGVAIDRYALQRAANSSGSELKIFEQTGPLVGHGKGEVRFPLPYAQPPNVELKTIGGLYVVVDVTANGFTWSNNSVPLQGQGGTWHAKGVKAAAVP